jgi:hypothetical protein
MGVSRAICYRVCDEAEQDEEGGIDCCGLLRCSVLFAESTVDAVAVVVIDLGYGFVDDRGAECNVSIIVLLSCYSLSLPTLGHFHRLIHGWLVIDCGEPPETPAISHSATSSHLPPRRLLHTSLSLPRPSLAVLDVAINVLAQVAVL